MISFFELNSDQIRVRDILNKNFLEIEIYAISNAEPNRNGSCFTIESMKKGVETFIDKPILGFFNSDDFEAHNGRAGYDKELEQEYWDNSQGEQILGFIRDSDSREIVEKDGLMWIKCTAMVYTQYNYKQVKKLLKDRRKKVSVEVRIKDSEIKNNIEYINEFELTGITILGSKNGIPVKEGIEGAHLSVLDLIDETRYNNQKQALVFAYSELKNENEGEKDLTDDYENNLENGCNNSEECPEECVKEYVEVCENEVQSTPLDEKLEEKVEEQSEKKAEEVMPEDKLEEVKLDENNSEDEKEPDCDCLDNKLQAECDELKMRCEELDAKKCELEAKCGEFEEKCCKYNEEICALKEQLCKYEDYEATKLALEEANKKLEEIRVNEQKCYIQDVACKMKLENEEFSSVIEKCERHEFQATEDIDKDIAYIVYKKNIAQANNDGLTKFEAPIVEEPIIKSEKIDKKEKISVTDRLKNNINRK